MHLHDSGVLQATEDLALFDMRLLEGCGTNKMKVFYAYLFEDTARNDADGPSYNTSTCIGAETR